MIVEALEGIASTVGVTTTAAVAGTLRPRRPWGFNDRRGGRDRERHREYANSTCVFVDNLLPGTRWQDLADVLTKVAPVLPGTVRMNRGGRGATVRFERKEDAERVISELHGTDFGPDGNMTKMELKLAPPREDRRRGGGGRGRDERRDERPPQEERPREDRQTSRSRSPVRGHGREGGAGEQQATNQAEGDAEEQQAAETTAQPEEPTKPAEEPAKPAEEAAKPAEEAVPANDGGANNEQATDNGEKQDSNGSKPDYDSMSYADLRAMCKDKGISASGKKADLIEKLKEA